MKLSRKKAIELCIELWEWLAKTGKQKRDWPRWGEIEKKYGFISSHCFFCKMTFGCEECPYYEKFGHCMDGIYGKWLMAESIEDNQKYAKLFLEQIKMLK